MSQPVSENGRKSVVNDDNLIEEVLVGFDDDNNLVFLMDTRTQKYGLIVFLAEHTDLGWQEIRAIIDCFRVSQAGLPLDVDGFREHAKYFSNKYGNAKGPFHPDENEEDILMIAIYPTRGSIDMNIDNTIVRTSLSFGDEENVFYLGCVSNKGNSYAISIYLQGNESQFNASECKAMIASLIVMEPGDIISFRTFDKYIESLKEEGMHIQDKKGTDHKGSQTYMIQLCLNNIPKDINVLEQEYFKNNSEINKLALKMDTQNKNNLVCPYPGVTYDKTIKKGGQAQVFKGKRNEMNVAIKVFLDGTDQIDTYKTELRMLLQMTQHKNVVSIIDFFETPKPALVMDFINGQDLSEYLKINGPMNQTDGLNLCIGIAEGLTHMHKYGIIHRDLKSANILRRVDGVPIIIDLGLSSKLSRYRRKKGTHPNSSSSSSSSISSNQNQSHYEYHKQGQKPELKNDDEMSIENLCTTVLSTHISEQTKTIKGTMLWMAPEMITSHSWSDRTDVYSFGMIMWEIFTGKLPFLTESANKDMSPMSLLVAIATGTRPNVQDIPSTIDNWIVSLIEQCWVTDPKKRPKMANVLHRLQRYNPRSIFDDIDLDKSGSLNFTEFVVFLDKYIPNKIPPEKMHPLFKSIDTNNSGQIGYAEFKSLWKFVSNRFLS